MTFLTEQQVDETSKKIGRSCGECSLCCLLTDVPDAGKQHGQWCPHCRPGAGGCSIYKSRPEICRRYTCMWLVNKSLPDYWQPLRSKMIIDYDTIPSTGEWMLRVHVHPHYPERWQQEPYFTDLKRMAAHGIVRTPKYRTIILIGDSKREIKVSREAVA